MRVKLRLCTPNIRTKLPEHSEHLTVSASSNCGRCNTRLDAHSTMLRRKARCPQRFEDRGSDACRRTGRPSLKRGRVEEEEINHEQTVIPLRRRILSTYRVRLRAHGKRRIKAREGSLKASYGDEKRMQCAGAAGAYAAHRGVDLANAHICLSY
ncbi:hypothetical protein BD626DRAFT_503234 [Schizophyllum amplum]|uniref:Uncharacterized protein n=1 Tax=Schizophyllum amplum TaxID=97359 RepID=A0A550C825_9AGAR|nr:hypothetical protein BD626DRAFT_503234 [Auriculariopsis ampla]